ncbi:MAG: hypothetical protein WA840_00105 [Caulobacteraceae bacterium]
MTRKTLIPHAYPSLEIDVGRLRPKLAALSPRQAALRFAELFAVPQVRRSWRSSDVLPPVGASRRWRRIDTPLSSLA